MCVYVCVIRRWKGTFMALCPMAILLLRRWLPQHGADPRRHPTSVWLSGCQQQGEAREPGHPLHSGEGAEVRGWPESLEMWPETSHANQLMHSFPREADWLRASATGLRPVRCFISCLSEAGGWWIPPHSKAEASREEGILQPLQNLNARLQHQGLFKFPACWAPCKFDLSHNCASQFFNTNPFLSHECVYMPLL